MRCAGFQRNRAVIYQHVKIFPVILRHEAEECQEGPSEAVKAGVAIVWIPPSLHACVALRAAPESSQGQSFSNHETRAEGGDTESYSPRI